MLKQLLRIARVREFVSLCARSLHGRTPPAVQYPELDHGLIDKVSHDAAHGIDFPDKVALCKPSYRRIAAEPPDGIKGLCDHQS